MKVGKKEKETPAKFVIMAPRIVTTMIILSLTISLNYAHVVIPNSISNIEKKES
jgi:hypothetical protein